tara:strand:+ start:644 stop:781 length:138 start_codon:yes stop_codon:yes gene_type:complete
MQYKSIRTIKVNDDSIQGRKSGIAVESYYAKPDFLIQIILKTKND